MSGQNRLRAKAMKRFPNNSERAYQHRRAVILFVLCSGIYLLGLRTPCAFATVSQSPNGARGPLKFAERLAYQYAIEEVYWRHRIWPKDNPQPKPPLDAIVSQIQVEQKVESYLRKSRLVAASRRMFAFSVRVPPRRWNSRSWRTRRNFAWADGLISLTSSRKRTPPDASSI